MAYPPVVVVDENDNEVGSGLTAEVWQKGLYHRIVSIFVEDDEGRMLLQRRAPHMKVYPNCWDQAAGGHVDEGFTYEQAAAAELAEELGLEDVALEKLATYRYNGRDGERIINQFVRVYHTRVPHDVVLLPQAEEVATLQWFTPAELRALVAEHPETCTSGFLQELRQYFPSFVE